MKYKKNYVEGTKLICIWTCQVCFDAKLGGVKTRHKTLKGRQNESSVKIFTKYKKAKRFLIFLSCVIDGNMKSSFCFKIFSKFLNFVQLCLVAVNVMIKLR